MAQMPILRNYLGKNQKSAHQLKKTEFFSYQNLRVFPAEEIFFA